MLRYPLLYIHYLIISGKEFVHVWPRLVYSEVLISIGSTGIKRPRIKKACREHAGGKLEV